ncbi:uncharacterized protein PV09_04569 [Verruconis gallopava]|uniref:Arrestin C-terminal-like domain-containing protein n=1 Tax=Verruconis gallopava TaxID=253628 RepID=A0A0D1YUA7_9PEZI|nr:uncharacterized protein PV09_04569 [Verruconis gallopava]KIW04267.1 hypothetical protein PV09_04569 [Verruconis gallopava]
MLQLGGGKTKTSKNFEIKLDSPFVVFHGDPHEAEPVELTGTLWLSNSDHMNVRSIKIRLEGKWKVSWYVEPGVSSLQIREKGTHLSEELTLHPAEGVGSSNVTHKIAPGVHEWRFKFLLDPYLPESVEGLASSFCVYDLKAEIDRGYMSKALVTEKHVRIIRTLGRDMTETVPLPYSNEDTWRDKLWYHIYIPTRYHIFGTSITVEFILCPLLKGVTIGKIKMEILERVQLKTDAGRFKDFSKDVVVASHEQDMPDNILPERVEETSGIPDQSHHFKVTLPLPKSLNKMRQSVDTEHIKIFHNLKVYVNLHNPDGHISQLLVRNLLHIFISPNLPVGDDQTIQGNAAQVASVSHNNENGQLEAPPTYELHQLDQLYDDIDPSAFLSGANTPYRALSRHNSDEDLRTNLDSTTINNTYINSGSRTPGLIGEASSPSAAQLQRRLAELQGHDGQIDEDFTHPTPRNSPRQTARVPRAVSFRGSYHQNLNQLSSQSPPNHSDCFHSVVTPEGEYDMDALTRIPSYSTAVRTPVVTPPSSYYELPTYDIAVSTPSSPQHLPVQPPRAHTACHVGEPRRQSSLSGSSDSGSIRNFDLSNGHAINGSSNGPVQRPEQAARSRRMTP